MDRLRDLPFRQFTQVLKAAMRRARDLEEMCGRTQEASEIRAGVEAMADCYDAEREAELRHLPSAMPRSTPSASPCRTDRDLPISRGEG